MGPEREIKAVQDMYLHDNMCRLLLIPLTICHACVEPSKSPLTLDILVLRSSFHMGMPQSLRTCGKSKVRGRSRCRALVTMRDTAGEIFLWMSATPTPTHTYTEQYLNRNSCSLSQCNQRINTWGHLENPPLELHCCSQRNAKEYMHTHTNSHTHTHASD